MRKSVSLVRSVGRDVSSGPPIPLKGNGGGSVNRAPRRIFREEGENVVDVDRLLALPKQQRRAALDRLALSLMEESGERRDSEMWSAAVSSALEGRLGRQGSAAYGPLLAKRVVGAPAAFKPVASFVEEARLDEMTVVRRQQAMNLLAELVVESASQVGRAKGIPLSLGLVAGCAANVRAIFDQAFPGYLESGLAGIVFGRTSSPAEWDGSREVAR